jgi:hypothetical protein
MTRIKRLPLPEPYTADAAVTTLYMAWTNKGACQVECIVLRNPAMVEAIDTLWRSAQQDDLPDDALASGTIDHVGRWTLWRADREQGGCIHIQYTPGARQE